MASGEWTCRAAGCLATVCRSATPARSRDQRELGLPTAANCSRRRSATDTESSNDPGEPPHWFATTAAAASSTGVRWWAPSRTRMQLFTAAQKLAELYTMVSPNYRAVMESYQKAQSVVRSKAD